VRWGTAEEAGFDPEALGRAWAVLERETASRAVPAAVAAVGRRGVAVGPRAFGWAVWEPSEAREAARPDTLFDLASLTKVVATATLCWVFVERGRLRLGEPVAHLVPEFLEGAEGEARRWREEVQVRHLLLHNAGLPAHRDLRRVPGGREERLRAVAATPLEARPGERVVYSDLGFILLGWILERVGGAALDTLCREALFAPLGMEDTLWNPPPGRRGRAAATEWVEGAEAPDDRPGPLRGVVHDENARALGGLAGHAGLFSTAHDLAVFLDALRAGGVGGPEPGRRILSAAAVRAMTRPVVVGERDARTLGWQAAGRAGAPYGDLWSERSFGHTGFTGTSVWVDPEHDLWVVLLTNAVHMGRRAAQAALPRLRTTFHNAVVGAVRG
jgi:CubicO group peptidase (beta-lactamase class C family)